MAWYYVLNGASLGPVAEADLRRLRDNRTVASDTLVWTAGMAEWVPYQKSSLVTGLPIVSALPGTRICAECGQPFPEGDMLRYENSWVCASCKPLFFQRLKEGVVPRGHFVYASVGKRFVAILLDGIILFFGIVVCVLPLILVATWVTGPNHQTFADNPVFPFLIIIAEYLVPAAYEIFFVGRYGATPGKMLMKIKVVTAEGGHVSYARSTGRYFSKILSALILYIGFLMAFWDDEKRTLHDRICSTLVIER